MTKSRIMLIFLDIFRKLSLTLLVLGVFLSASGYFILSDIPTVIAGLAMFVTSLVLYLIVHFKKGKILWKS